ncbi:flavoprotein [Streptomyces virginiae]|uniref:flavoprotein n=1 Tax=Streptomyces TaxID=1883 RepID=UPI0007C83557|nr:flavoprotein [Streptomyces sp. IGB124]
MTAYPPRQDAHTAVGAPETVESVQVAPFGISRLLLVVTGSASAIGLPQWLGWLRREYPQLTVRVAMSRSAERFVTPLSLGLRLEEDVEIDAWEECTRARHVEYAEWAQAVLVYPSTFHFTARLALGLADTPVLLALQCTDAIVAVAPSLPPGGLDSPAFRSHWSTLAARPNVVLVPPAPGYSLTTGREDGWVPPPLTEALRRIEDRRTEREREREQERERRERAGSPTQEADALAYAALLADGAQA